MEPIPLIRLGAERCAMLVHRASFATTPMGGMGPPKADISRPLDVVTIHLWSTRPRRRSCLASRRETSVK